MANWNVHNDNLNDIGNLESNFLIRRARLKFDGFAYSPKLSYKVELELSNRGLDHEGAKYYGEGGNLILDAYLKWNFYKGFSLKVGQFNQPGRVVARKPEQRPVGAMQPGHLPGKFYPALLLPISHPRIGFADRAGPLRSLPALESPRVLDRCAGGFSLRLRQPGLSHL